MASKRAAAPGEEDIAMDPGALLCGLRALVAEDDPINQLVIWRLLERKGGLVTLGNNGREAVELVKKGAFDLILMDIQMQEMDGYEASKRIRALDGPGDPPIIAVMDHALTRERDKCLNSGMNGYLAKL